MEVEIARGEIVVPVEDGYRDHLVTVPQPPVGTDWSYVLPSHARLMSARCVLTASATVISRTPEITFSMQGAGEYLRLHGDGQSTASSAFLYQWFDVAYSAFSGSAFQSPSPQMWLPKTTTIAMKTSSLQAGDQWSGIVLMMRMHHKPVSV